MRYNIESFIFSLENDQNNQQYRIYLNQITPQYASVFR